MVDDVSKKTLVALLLITIIISLVGTWLVLNGISSVGNRVIVIGQDQIQAQASININPPVSGLTIASVEGAGNTKLIIR